MSELYTAEQVQEKIATVTKRVEDHYEDQLVQMDKQITAYKEAAEQKDKLHNLRGWAIDRAISMLRGDNHVISFNEVRDVAEKLAHYAYGEEYQEMTGTKQ